MSLLRRAKKRDASEPEIVTALKKAGFSVCRIDTPVDLLVGIPARKGKRQTHLVECKSGKAKLNENQEGFVEGWRGSPVVVLRDAQEAMDWAVQVSGEAA